MTMVQPAIKKHDFPMLIGDEPVRTPKVRTINLPYDGTPVADVYDADGEPLGGVESSRL